MLREIERTVRFKGLWKPYEVARILDMIRSFPAEIVGVVFGILKMLQMDADSSDNLDEATVIAFKFNVDVIEKGTNLLQVRDINVFLDQIRISLIVGAPKRVVKSYLDSLEGIIVHELRDRYCYVLERGSERLLDHNHIESQFSKLLPRCLFDLIEAQSCLAFGRNTACVYHCMCALESVWDVVGKMMKRLKVPWEHDKTLSENWNVTLNNIDKAIKPIPGQKKTRRSVLTTKALSEVSLHMRSVKNAWRNDTMHARGQFTEETAADIFSQTCSFLKFVCTKL